MSIDDHGACLTAGEHQRSSRHRRMECPINEGEDMADTIHPRDALKERMLASVDDVLYGLIDGLAALGSSQDQWDSESIEVLLGQIEKPLKTLGIPSIGNTESDWDAHVFWYRVENGEDPADPADPYSGNADDARDDWKYEVANGDTDLGFTDWWAHQIEMRRDG